ncbi:hypothetical protein OAW25_00535 [Gammaproteobacteria bacterium]|nr:hypothetical protein [Gammaproteobacteria bacterium]
MTIPKLLTSLCLILAGMGPLLLDIGDTHLFNPNWDEHSRVHEVWRLATNLMIAFLGLYLIWKKNMHSIASLLSLCMILGFMISVITMPFYNGLAVGIGIDELRPFNIPLNILSFIIVLVVQTISLLLAYKDNK